MLFALVGREISERRSAIIATLSFLVVVVASGKAFFPFFDAPEANGSLEAINWFATHDIPADTKLYCTPNDQLTLTFLAGVPVQSVAPVEKKFYNNYRAGVILIEPPPPYQTLQIPDIVRLAAEHGQILSD